MVDQIGLIRVVRLRSFFAYEAFMVGNHDHDVHAGGAEKLEIQLARPARPRGGINREDTIDWALHFFLTNAS